MKKFYFASLFILFTILINAQGSTPKNSSFTSDLQGTLDYAQNQIMQLAEAVPEEKYGWRPSEGVRSVSELFMHIAGGNYFLLSMAGNPMPKDFKNDMEKTVTKKSEVISFLKKSFEDTKNYIAKLNEEDLDKPVDMFGNPSNQRSLLLVVFGHNYEHLGQAIAYARVNGIVPPWSQKQQE